MLEQSMDGRRPATWLEIVRAAFDTRQRVQIHPIPLADGKRIAVSLASRLLCSNDGRITVFEDLAAAVRFLRVAGIQKWTQGDALHGMAGLLASAERLRLKDGRLSA